MLEQIAAKYCLCKIAILLISFGITSWCAPFHGLHYKAFAFFVHVFTDRIVHFMHLLLTETFAAFVGAGPLVKHSLRKSRCSDFSCNLALLKCLSRFNQHRGCSTVAVDWLILNAYDVYIHEGMLNIAVNTYATVSASSAMLQRRICTSLQFYSDCRERIFIVQLCTILRLCVKTSCLYLWSWLSQCPYMLTLKKGIV